MLCIFRDKTYILPGWRKKAVEEFFSYAKKTLVVEHCNTFHYLGETILNICQQANHLPCLWGQSFDEFWGKQPWMSKIYHQNLPLLSGRHAAACETKPYATGGFTFPCFLALFCITQVTGNILMTCGTSVWGGYGRRCCLRRGAGSPLT